MRGTSGPNRLSLLGLLLLGLVALGVSVAAILQFRPDPSQTARPAPVAIQTPASPTASSPANLGTPSATPVVTPTQTVPTEEPPRVVVIGDSHSLADRPGTWVGAAAEELGWGKVDNLSSPGRGYVVKPRSCDFEPCDNFVGSVSTIVKKSPDIVVSFGGTADGDRSIEQGANDYFKALRKALPEAQLVAINPVTSNAVVPERMAEHSRLIKRAVESVDGVFIDVGQPGVGDGQSLSKKTQAKIAGIVVQELSSLKPSSEETS